MAEMLDVDQIALAAHLKTLQKMIAEDLHDGGVIKDTTVDSLMEDPVESLSMLRALAIYNLTVHWRDAPSSAVLEITRIVRKIDPEVADMVEAYPEILKISADAHVDTDPLTKAEVMQNVASEHSRVPVGVFLHLRKFNESVQQAVSVACQTLYRESMNDFKTMLDEVEKQHDVSDDTLQDMKLLLDSVLNMDALPDDDLTKDVIARLKRVCKVDTIEDIN